jgi:hypothetical protein
MTTIQVIEIIILILLAVNIYLRWLEMVERHKRRKQ